MVETEEERLFFLSDSQIATSCHGERIPEGDLVGILEIKKALRLLPQRYCESDSNETVVVQRNVAESIIIFETRSKRV